jgi:Tol biopolymer transport system component
MNKVFLSAAMVLLTISGASALTVGETTKVDIEAGAFHPVLSPDGQTLLYSTQDHTGLKALSLTDGTVTVIDNDAAAGFSPLFTADGGKVYYQTASIIDGLLYRDVRSFNMKQRAEKPRKARDYSRQDVDLTAMTGDDTYAVAQYRTIKVVMDGVEKQLNPISDSHSYLWASLSPDKQHLMFVEPFEGVFVANADGTNSRRIATKGDYASWAGNEWAVTILTHDDGYVVLDSKLIATNIATGETVTLTDDNTLVGEVTASASGRIIYSDINGQLYTLTIK